MTAPFVDRTIRKIDTETDRLTRSLMRAELACYWARVGEFEKAEQLRSDLRSEFGDGKSPRVSIMIMCLEGLLLYFRDLGKGAKDRLDRARLLAGAIQDPHLVAFASAWQAHIAFNRYDFSSMAVAVDDCLENASERDHSALLRITLVLGDLFAYLRNWHISQAWYSAAHDFAVKLGDRASVNAITYNRAAFRVFELRLREAEHDTSEADLDLLDAEVRSADNYQTLVEVRSLGHLMGCARLSSFVLRNQFSSGLTEAHSLLQANLTEVDLPQYSLVLADAARCSAELGEIQSANGLFEQCRSINAEAFPIDDKVLFYSQLDRVADLLGRIDDLPARANSVEALIGMLDSQRIAVQSQMNRFATVPDIVYRAAKS